MKALFYLEIVLFESYSDKDYKFEENESCRVAFEAHKERNTTKFNLWPVLWSLV